MYATQYTADRAVLMQSTEAPPYCLTASMWKHEWWVTDQPHRVWVTHAFTVDMQKYFIHLREKTHGAFSFTHRLAVATDIDVQHALPQRLQSVHRLLRPAQGQDSTVSSQQILNRKKTANAVWLVGNDRFSWGWKLGWKVMYILCMSVLR